MWQTFLKTPHLGDYLGMAGLLLTFVGFGITIRTALQAKTAADAAKTAADQARNVVKKLDLVAEMATVLQLLEELKRLHRSKAVEILPDRYSALRLRILSIRESGVLVVDDELQLLQDIVVRLSSLETTLDKGEQLFEDKKQLARANNSLSICSEAVIRLNEKIKTKATEIS